MITDVAEIPASAEPASWLCDGIHGFYDGVVSLVPDGFPAYARIFHPAATAQGSGEDGVTWAPIALARGRAAHAGMQWPSIVGTDKSMYSVPRPLDHPGVEPLEGSLPRSVARILVGVLADHTQSPNHCWFGIWEGFGTLLETAVIQAPTFELPHRSYYLMSGPIASIEESVTDAIDQSANLWWPEDRAWCVATEIDLDTTFIAATRGCVDALLAKSELEVYEVGPSDRVTRDSDLLNPPPTDLLANQTAKRHRWRLSLRKPHPHSYGWRERP